MKTSISILLTAIWLLIATRPIATLSQGVLESYGFARINRLSMALAKRLGAYLAVVLIVLVAAIATTWTLIATPWGT